MKINSLFLYGFRRMSFLLMTAVLVSCGAAKEVVYFQDIDEVNLVNRQLETNIKIKPGDRLTIMVFGPDKYLIMPYNQTLHSVSVGNAGSGGDREDQLPYDVDDDGYIKFPVLGVIKVSGMTTDELKELLYSKLSKEIKDATIFVSIENFHINVLGEMEHPGTFEIKNNSCTLLEALALAGDMKITADRKNVCLIRMEDGLVKHYFYDLTKSDILDSPHLYLQQNDVIYVPPTRSRSVQGRANTEQRVAILSTITTVVSVAGLLVAILK